MIGMDNPYISAKFTREIYPLNTIAHSVAYILDGSQIVSRLNDRTFKLWGAIKKLKPISSKFITLTPFP